MGHITSEKQSPSAIDFLGDLKQAIVVERRMARGSKPLKDLLSKVVADYNRMVTVKHHRIDGSRRSLVYNMFLGKKPERETFWHDVASYPTPGCGRLMPSIS